MLCLRLGSGMCEGYIPILKMWNYCYCRTHVFVFVFEFEIPFVQEWSWILYWI